MHPIAPFIWFKDQAEEAINYYIETFPNSRIVHIERYAGDQGIPGETVLKDKVLTAVFELNGQTFMCLDGGDIFKPGGNISLYVEFDDQADVDRVWDRLLDGGQAMQCGWVTDKFGTTWQICPTVLGKLMSDPAATAAQKTATMQAMQQMVKLDGPALQRAFDGAA